MAERGGDIAALAYAAELRSCIGSPIPGSGVCSIVVSPTYGRL